MAETARQRSPEDTQSRQHPQQALSSQAPRLHGWLPWLQKQKETFTWTGGPSNLRRSGHGGVGSNVFQKPAGSDGLEVPGSEDCLGFALLSSPLKSSQMHRPPGALPRVCPRSPGEADGRALRGHSSSCSSSSEPEGPWRTSSYHLLVSVFIWMRPWWRSSWVSRRVKKGFRYLASSHRKPLRSCRLM